MISTQPRAHSVVLAAVDGSEQEHEVVRAAANLARSIENGELHIVHVVEDLPPPVMLVPRPMGLGITTAEIVSSARKRLDATSRDARALFAGRIVGHLTAGSAWKQILQVALDVQADVVLVGTHGRSGIKRMLLGSVAEAVVRKASCPVIVVRAKDYHAYVPPEIEPACPACMRARLESSGEQLWCEAHAKGNVHGEHFEVARTHP
jgi:nucleotide-binding universal stress UspA family protein